MTSSKYSFTCKGHPNIQGTHKNTIEFTKDTHVTPRGDCIIGVDADFDSEALMAFLKDKKTVTISMEARGARDTVTCKVHHGFSSRREIVLRKGTFLSERTLGIEADKGARDVKRELVEALRQEIKLNITISV